MKTMKKLIRKPLAWVLAFALVLTCSLAAANWKALTGQADTIKDGVSAGDGSAAGDAGSAGTNEGAAAENGASGGEAQNQQDPSLIGGTIAVGNKLTWEKINSVPVKTENMSVAEARQLCVDFFRFTKTTLWTPSENIKYIRNSAQKEDAIYTGVIYGGLPYVTMASGNIYRLMDYIDEAAGVVDMRDALNITTENSMAETLTAERLKYFGGQCSMSAYWGWGRVINSVSTWWTDNMTETFGFIPLAEYGKANHRYWGSYQTSDALTYNGQAAMNTAYAQLQMADGLVSYIDGGGHTIMCATNAHVEYDTDGNIDPDNSYIYIIDQAQLWEDFSNDFGDNYTAKSNVDEKMTFTELFNESYFPFTFAEFTGADDIENTEAAFSYSGSTITKSQLFSAQVTANYGISDVYAIVTDAEGTEIYRHVVRAGAGGVEELDLAQSGANVDSWGTLSSGTYTVEVVVQLSTGERLTLYTGELVD